MMYKPGWITLHCHEIALLWRKNWAKIVLNEFRTQFLFEITFILMKTLKMSDIFAYWKKL